MLSNTKNGIPPRQIKFELPKQEWNEEPILIPKEEIAIKRTNHTKRQKLIQISRYWWNHFASDLQIELDFFFFGGGVGGWGNHNMWKQIMPKKFTREADAQPKKQKASLKPISSMHTRTNIRRGDDNGVILFKKRKIIIWWRWII